MSKKTDKKKLSNILADIEVALAYQKEGGWLESCQRWLGYVDNKYPSDLNTPYTVNTFLSLLNLIVPNLYYSDPVIKVGCRKEEIIVTKNREVPLNIPGYLAASLQEDILNALYPRIGVGREMQKGVQDALIYGWAPFKVGLSVQSESDRELPLLPKKTVYVSSICPEDLPYDPMGTGSFDACSFVCHRFIKDLESLKDDPDLKDVEILEGHTIAEGSPKGELYKAIKKNTLRKYITLYEYHDQLANKCYLVAHDKAKDDDKSHGKKLSDVDKPLILKEWSPDKGFPGSAFSLLRFTTIGDRIRGISLIGSQEDQALAINNVFTAQVRHIAMFGGVFVYERGSLTEDQLYAWEYSKQGDMLEVEPNAMQQGRLRRESPLQMGGDYFNCISSFHQLIDRGIGIPDFQQLYQTKRKTATESAFEQGDSRVRRDYLLASVKETVIDISRKVLSIVHKHYSLSDIEELVGYHVPKDLWEAVSDIELYQLDIDIESMIVYNQSMATGLMQAINYLASNPVTHQEVMKLDGAKIAKRVFKGFGANIDYFRRDDEAIVEEQNPERENDQIEEGRILPSPLPFEDHEDHVKRHKAMLIKFMAEKDEQKAQRLMDHIQMHEYYTQVFAQMTGTAQPPASQGQGSNVPLNNPAGGQPQPGQQPPPDQGEVVGNFRRG